MATTVTIDRVTYTLEKLPSGNIRVTHAGGQLHPMQGPGTDDLVTFEVHPVQTRWYAYWHALLEAPEQGETGPGAEGEGEDAIPWWSSKGWKAKSRRGSAGDSAPASNGP